MGPFAFAAAVVRGGRVVEQGRHSELVKVTGGFYAGLVARQQLGGEEGGEDGDAADGETVRKKLALDC